MMVDKLFKNCTLCKQYFGLEVLEMGIEDDYTKVTTFCHTMPAAVPLFLLLCGTNEATRV